MKTILVTGGLGFIGSNLVRYLYNKYPEYHIIVLDALTYAGSVSNAPENAMDSTRFTFWYGNICNGELVDSLVQQADIVIHMAAESHVARSIYDNRLFFETDVLGTQTVTNAIVKNRPHIELFVHMSTSEVYGTALTDKMDEHHPLNPMSPYASAKCGADRLVYSYWATYQIPSVIIRPFNNFGPRQHLEKAVPRFITSCILDEPITIHGDGSAARDWLFVEDHCRALDKVIHAPREHVIGQTFNIGTDHHISIKEIAEAVYQAMGEPANSPITFIGDRPGQVIRHTCDSSKIRKTLDWKPLTSFEQGLEKTIQWYRDNKEWWAPQRWMRHIPIISAAGRREMH